MFLRSKKRCKDGKTHRYFSVVENRRVRSGRVVQRQVLFLGEINDSQQAAWRQTLEVFDEAEQRAATLSLFPEDRAIPADALDGVQVKLAEMELRRPRAFGNYWLGCELWRQLGLGAFWEARLGEGREEVPWAKVLELLVVSRLVSPGSEFRLHRQGFDQSALGDLLGTGFAVAEKDRLYRCLDRILKHKAALFEHLRQRWQELFQARFDVLLYDLTSTYIEGEGEAIPKAQHGYSRDHRFDCRQVVIALVVTPEGFPLAYEVMEGNTSDRTTLRGFLAKIEAQYGRARRVWLMDRGIPTEEVLQEMRAPEREVFYLVGTPRGKIQQYEKKWLELPWQKVRASVEVKLFAEEGELYVLAKSAGRRAKEHAIRRRKLVRLLWKLRDLRRKSPARDQLLLRIGAAKKDAGRAFGFVHIHLPQEGDSRHPPDLHVPTRQRQVAEGRTPRRALSAALEPGGRECRRAVGTLPPTHPDRSRVQDPQKRVGPAPDLSPARKPRGGPHPGGLPRLRPLRHPETKVASPGPRPHPAGGAGKAGDDSDAGCLPAYHRRPLADHATLHPAGTRSSPDAPPAQSVLAFTTAPSPQGPGGAGKDRAADTENVVPTFENPSLKTNHLPLSYPLNCESSVNLWKSFFRVRRRSPRSSD